MQIFKSIYITLSVLSMSSHYSIQKHPFNARNLSSLLIHGVYLCGNIGFLFSGIENLIEFTDSVFLCITTILATTMFIHVDLKMRQIFEFLRRLEEIVNQSKKRFKIFKSICSYSSTIFSFLGLNISISNDIYSKIREKIQKVVKVMKFSMAVMTPICLVVSKFLISI